MIAARIAAPAALALAAGVAHAGSIVQSGSIPMQPTDWSGAVAVDQFDVVGGTRALVQVHWTITGTITAGAEVESLDASPTTVTFNLGSHMEMSAPGGLIGSIDPVVSASFDAAAFDGDIDFGGPSGASFGPLTATLTASGAAADVTPFIGGGQVPLTIEAIGSSWSTGSGNVITGLTTDAAFEYSVVYTFQDVPTPGSLALCAVSAIALSRRRR